MQLELHEKIKAMVKSGMTYRAVAKAVGVSSSKVSNIVNGVFAYNKGWRKKESIKMYQSGMSIKQIAERLGLDYCTVWEHVQDVRTTAKRRVLDHDRIAHLARIGFTTHDIAINIGTTANVIRYSLRKHGSTPKKVVFDDAEDKEISACLFVDGYSVEQISLLTGIVPSRVKRYTRGLKMHKVERPVKKKTLKKKPKKTFKISAIEHRSVIGKGIEAGVYDTKLVLRDDRDHGRLVFFYYSDISKTPSIKTSIRVKDGISDEEAVSRWCKRAGKRSWRLVF